MKRKFLIYAVTLIILGGCSKSVKKEISFYHWKNDTSISKIEKQYLKTLEVKQVYVRFFDIDLNDNNHAYPLSVVKEMDSILKGVDVIPVVYITNNTFKNDSTTKGLSKKVSKLINDMYNHHFDTIPTKVQIDCDWTNSTKSHYFSFLEELKKEYEISVTIRLHQVKYKDKTGVPPVNEGTLMAYNMGELMDSVTNSIFSDEILKKYINKSSSYPLSLDIALPLYSWGVAKFPNGKVKLLNNLTRKDIEVNEDSFKKITDLTYKVIKPHFLKGFYLTKETLLKIEEVSYEEVLESKRYMHSCSKMNWNKTILYHLDEEVLKNYTINQLLELK
jgi:hypothetical protein